MFRLAAVAMSAVFLAAATAAPSTAAAATSTTTSSITASPPLASPSLDPETACLAANANVLLDYAMCAASKSSDDYHRCICAIPSLVQDLQATFNACPASEFSAGPSTGPSTGGGFANVPELYSIC
ncbi:hypothetical protein HK405_002558, partial [Cladochytrium tenue]